MTAARTEAADVRWSAATEGRLMRNDILGVWTLRSFHTEDLETGERLELFGSDPRGRLMLHPDGRMAVIITPEGSSTPAGAARSAAASPQLIAYSGRYRVEPPDRLVTAVDIASFPDWVGTDQARTFALDGDGLTLVTPSGRMPRHDGSVATVVGTLTWVRES